ncbi:MAG: DUF1013 domain-containing protein [Alphaproteobacteria bacterium]|nr:DUF1013 domain-containing protein [Alphaproteobacteria bacterium]
MAQVLMPKATAVWLIEHTGLTFEQVADFCGLHPLEVQSIADDEVVVGMVGFDPINSGQLTREEITRCEADPSARLKMAEANVPRPTTRTKGPRYTPVAKRQDRPDAIAWLLRNFPELSDGQVSRLVGTTKPTISAVRDRTHWNIGSIKPRDPVALGICSREDLRAAIEKARRALERAEKRRARDTAKDEAASAAPMESPADSADDAAPESDTAPAGTTDPFGAPAADDGPGRDPFSSGG